MDSLSVVKTSLDKDVRACMNCTNCQNSLKTIFGIMLHFFKGENAFWFLRVNEEEFDEFLDSIDPIFKSGDFSLIPFMCLCKRQGSHILIIADFKPTGSFPSVWGNRPKIVINTGRQLLKLIHYLGQNKCFCIPPGESIDMNPTENHFDINKPVTESVAITAMISLFPSMGFEDIRKEFEDKEPFWVFEDGWKVMK